VTGDKVTGTVQILGRANPARTIDRVTTPRGERTRQHLLDVAEDLFGRRGFDNVSLREIRLAADQRNAGAVQYHFGDRDGVLLAIVERHQPRLEVRREQLLEVARANPDDLLGWVEVIVVPLAEYVELGPSERSWLRICADGLSRPSLEALDAGAGPSSREAGKEVYRLMAPTIPHDLALERMIAAVQATIHICADRARALTEAGARKVVPAEIFAANLVDMMGAALMAPQRGGRRASAGGPDRRQER
jgi:AcrR family transcriptional regulator